MNIQPTMLSESFSSQKSKDVTLKQNNYISFTHNPKSCSQNSVTSNNVFHKIINFFKPSKDEVITEEEMFNILKLNQYRDNIPYEHLDIIKSFCRTNNKCTQYSKINCETVSKMLNYTGGTKQTVDLLNICLTVNEGKTKECCANECLNLFKGGLNYDEIYNICKYCLNYAMTNLSKDYITSLSQNLPNITDSKELSDFIIERALISEYRNKYSHNKTLNQNLYTFCNNFADKRIKYGDSASDIINSLHFMRDDGMEVSKERHEFLIKNCDDKNLSFYINFLNDNPHDIDIISPKLDKLITYTNAGIDKEYLQSCYSEDLYDMESEDILNVIDEYKKEGIESKFLIPVYMNLVPRYLKTNNKSNVKTLCEILDYADKKRTILGSVNDPVTTEELYNTFIIMHKSTLQALNIFGKESMYEAMNQGIDFVYDFIEDYGVENIDLNKAQPFIEIVNPKGSIKYKKLECDINALKSKFQEVKTKEEKDKLIREIKKLSYTKNSLLDNSAKDITEKLNIANVYYGLIERQNNNYNLGEWDYSTYLSLIERQNNNYNLANSTLKYLTPKTDEEKIICNQVLNDLVWKSLKISKPKDANKNFYFKNNKYLSKMFYATEDFTTGFSTLVNNVSTYSHHKSVSDSLNTLPHNKETKKEFNKLGLNYKNWVKKNPNLNVNLSINMDYKKQAHDAIKNLEKEFNDEFFINLPTENKEKLIHSLKKGGYRLEKKKENIYDNVGFLTGSEYKNKLYNGDKPVEFKDLSKIYKIINTEVNSNSDWSKNNRITKTFLSHIDSRHEEMKRIRQLKSDETIDITIQKADMDDIPHSLFLGNDASCCTAVGSFNDFSAPNYIMTKAVQCIELKDKDEYIGNSMIYIAKINNKPALLIDNIELKPKYQYNDDIENGIIQFSKNLTKSLGKPDMPIYAGPNRHKLDMKNFESVNETFNLVGSSNYIPVYLDFISNSSNIDSQNKYEGILLKSRESTTSM